ncbi:MAG TPA: tetratricopeptide repeat protein [Candidatus Ozemobacteraceae bacterium]|nr:tetratricopeptide repeat protein [Candidatus Ozemobacteraceae bacterium]
MSRRFLSLVLMAGGFSIILGMGDTFWGTASAAGARDVNQACLEQFQAGEAALSARQYDRAIALYQAALSIRGDHLRSRYRLAQALVEAGRTEESLPQFQYLLEQSPQNIPARVLLSKALIATGRRAEAQKHLDWILQVQPGHAEAAALLGSIRPAAQGRTKSPAPETRIAAKTVEGIDADAAYPSVTMAAAGARSPVSKPAGSMSGTRAVQPVQAPAAASREFVPAGFQPLPVKQAAAVGEEASPAPAPARPEAARVPEIPAPPAAVVANGWRVSDFMQAASDSLPIVLNYATYCLEKDELKRAEEYLDRAEGLAIEGRETKRFLEVQIHKSLLSLYKADITGFGKQLIKVKPLLSRQTYLSFLDIYNKTQNATGPVDVARIVAGVAMGAEHYAVAARILSEVVQAMPGDLLAARLLSEAQMENRDFDGAERTLVGMVRRFPNDGESQFNLARFHLTARFNPEASKASLEAAARLNKGDPRITIVSALVDFAQGDLQGGLARLKKQLPTVKDSGLRSVCQRIIADGEAAARPGGPAIDFAGLLALPGSPAASPEAVNLIGERHLKRGSFFAALRCYMESRDLAEIGRAYLAIASSLAAAGENRASAVAAGYGISALREELKRSPLSARAHLYLALYHFERRDLRSARAEAQAGLDTGVAGETRRHLKALLDNTRG